MVHNENFADDNLHHSAYTNIYYIAFFYYSSSFVLFVANSSGISRKPP